jgi:glycosyltransferase involved in cell wall biosynthesis
VPELYETIYGASARRTKLLRLVQRWSVRRADTVITVTPEMRDALVANGARGAIAVVLNASVVAPGGVEPAPDRDAFTVICHGLVAERYGIHMAIEAVRSAADRVPGLRIWIVGDGPDRAALERRADELGVRDVVTFTGFVSDREVVDRLRRADLGLVLQLASPYSHLVHTTKMFEYVNFGIPVVATRLRATEALVPPDAIEFVDSGDSRALADTIVSLALDPGRRAAMAESAARLLAPTSWSRQRAVYLGALGVNRTADSGPSTAVSSSQE